MPDAIRPGPPDRPPPLDERIAAQVAADLRGIVVRIIATFGVPVVLAVIGGAGATYVAVQLQGERLEASARQRAEIVERIERIEVSLERAMDIRSDLRSLQATMIANQRAIEQRLDRLEGVR